MVMMGEPLGVWTAKPAIIFLFVEDTDAVYARAIQAGAEITPRTGRPVPRRPHGRGRRRRVWKPVVDRHPHQGLDMSTGTAAIGNVISNRTLTEMAMGYARSRALSARGDFAHRRRTGRQRTYPDRTRRDLRCRTSVPVPSSPSAGGSFGIVEETSPATFALTTMEIAGHCVRTIPNSEWAAIIFWADLLTADSWQSHLTECIRTGDTANPGYSARRCGSSRTWNGPGTAWSRRSRPAIFFTG